MVTIQKEQLKYINFLGVSLQYALINGVFWLNATEILNALLDAPIVQINKLKDGEHATLDGASAVQLFIPFSILSLTVQKLLFSKASKTDYFDKIMNGGGIEKLNQMLHYSNNMIFHTIESLLLDLEDAKKHNTLVQSFLDDKTVEFDRLNDDYETLAKNSNELFDNFESVKKERDEIQQQFTQQFYALNGRIDNIDQLNETISVKNDEIEQINADHESEKVKIQTANDEKAAKVVEDHAAEIQQLKDDHQEILRPLLERSNLRKFLLGRDMPLYVQIILQIIAAAFMFALIADHYKFTNLPDFICVTFQCVLTLMLPISYILFSLRKKNKWLYVVGFFEILVANHQTHLLDPVIKMCGLDVAFVESVFVTFFITVLGWCFGSLIAERESNKALLQTPVD